MKRLWTAIKDGYVRLLEPIAAFLVQRRVSPNVITTCGTICSIIGGAIYASGHISTGGWFLSITALFDVLDGTVARRTGRSTAFGAFYDSTLDRVADGAVLAGLTVFYATSAVLLALNHPREEARISVVQNLSNALLVLAAIPFGLNAVCAATVLRLFLLMPYAARTASRVCAIPGQAIVAATGLLFVLSLAMGGSVAALCPLLIQGVGPHLALAGLVAAALDGVDKSLELPPPITGVIPPIRSSTCW